MINSIFMFFFLALFVDCDLRYFLLSDLRSYRKVVAVFVRFYQFLVIFLIFGEECFICVIKDFFGIYIIFQLMIFIFWKVFLYFYDGYKVYMSILDFF